MNAAAVIQQLKDEEARHIGAMRLLWLALDQVVVQPGMSLVPYRSQWDGDAAKVIPDCGPTCLGMLLAWRGVILPIDTLSDDCGMGPNKRYTTDVDLKWAALGRGLSLATVRGYSAASFVLHAPSIALVHYGSLPRMDEKYTGGHWVVVVGGDDKQVIYHDPDWSGARRDEGANRAVAIEAFDKALADCAIDGNSAGYGLIAL